MAKLKILALIVLMVSYINLQDGFQRVCNSSRTLVICDEHHHAAVAAAGWKAIVHLKMQNINFDRHTNAI